MADNYLDAAAAKVSNNLSVVRASNPAATAAFPGAAYGAAASDNPQQVIDAVGGLQHAQQVLAGMQNLSPHDQAALYARARPEEQALYLANGYQPSQQVIDAGKEQTKKQGGFSLWHVLDGAVHVAGEALGAVNKYVLKPTGLSNIFSLAGKPLGLLQHVERFATVGLESLIHHDRLSQFYTPDGNLGGAGIAKLWAATSNGESMVWDMNNVLGDESIAHDTRQMALEIAQGKTQDDLAQRWGAEKTALAMRDPKFNDLVGRLNDEKVSVGRLAANLLGIHHGHLFHAMSGGLDAYLDWNTDPVQKALGHVQEARTKFFEVTGEKAGEKLEQLAATQPGYAQRLQSIADNAHNGFDPIRFKAEFPQLHRAGMTEYLAEAARKGELNSVEDVIEQFKKVVQPAAAAAGAGSSLAQVGSPLIQSIQITPGILAGKSTLIDALHDAKVAAKSDALQHLDAIKNFHFKIGDTEYHPLAKPVDAFKRLTTLTPSRTSVEGVRAPESMTYNGVAYKKGDLIIQPGFDPMAKGAIDTIESTAKAMGGYEYAQRKSAEFAAADYYGKAQIYKQIITDQFDLAINALAKNNHDISGLAEMRDTLMKQLSDSIQGQPGLPYQNPLTGQGEIVNTLRGDLGHTRVGIPATEGQIAEGHWPILDQRKLFESIRAQDFIHRHFGPVVNASNWMMDNIWRPSATVLRPAFGLRVGAEESFLYAMKKGAFSYLQGKLLAHQAAQAAGKLSVAGRALRGLAKHISPGAEAVADDILAKVSSAYSKVGDWTMSEGTRAFAAKEALEHPDLNLPVGWNSEAKMSFERAERQYRAIRHQETVGDYNDLLADGPEGYVDTMHQGVDVWHKQILDQQGTPTMQKFLEEHAALRGTPVSREVSREVDFGAGRTRTRGYMSVRDQELEGLHGNQSVYYNPANREELARSLEQNKAYQVSLQAHLREAGLPERVTVYRGGEEASGKYASVALDAQQARKVAADASGRSAENIKVTPMVVNRSDIVGYGRAGESELIIRNKPLTNDLETLQKNFRASAKTLYKSEEFRTQYANHPGLYTDPNIDVATGDMARRASRQMTALFTDEQGRIIEPVLDYMREHGGEAPPQEWLAHLPEDQWPKALKQGVVPIPGPPDNPVRYVTDRIGNTQGRIINSLRAPIYYAEGGKAMDELFSNGTYSRYERAFGPEVAHDLVYQQARDKALAARIDSIHDPGLRSQFAEWHRNSVPFWFAHEQFLKRWGKAIINDPSVFRRVQLTAAGLRSIGVIHRDPRGDYLVLPGATEAGKVLSKIPFVGKYVAGSVISSFDARIKAMSAGLSEGGRSIVFPGVGPAVTLPMKIITDIFPDAKPLAEKVNPIGSSQPIWKAIMPSWAANTLDAFGQDEHDQKFASAFTQATMTMMAQPTKYKPDGSWLSGALPENATPQDFEAFQDQARQRARSSLVLGALMGFVSPASPTANYSNKVTQLNREYTALIRETNDPGEATRIFYELHPNATVADFFQNAVALTPQSKGAISNVTLPLTKAVSDWFDNPDNEALVKKYGAAASFLLPQDPGAYDPDAYKKEIASGMRIRLDAQKDQVINGQNYRSFMNMVYINRDADYYYSQQKDYYAALNAARKAGNSGAVKQIEANWAFWKDGGVDENGVQQPGYLTSRPVLAQYVGESTGRELFRKDTLSKLTDMVNLPEVAANNPNTPAIKDLLDTWAGVQDELAALKGDRSTVARNARATLQTNFVHWAQGLTNPVAKMVYQSLLSQELVQFAQDEQTAQGAPAEGTVAS